MAEIILNKQKFDIEGIVFDKDGTLIDFHATWGPILRKAVNHLIEPFNEKTTISDAIFRTLGVDQVSMRAGDGPYSISTFDKIGTVVATVLYQHGMTWTQAEQRVEEIFKVAAQTPPALDQLTPTTDLPKLFDALQANGIKVGLATADNRHGTLDTLEKLQCYSESVFIACGDDSGLPPKPDPALLDAISSHWGTTTNRIAMVGDTIGDVHMARRAGAVSIGVLTGAGTIEMLEPYTDTILNSIDDINVALADSRT